MKAYRPKRRALGVLLCFLLLISCSADNTSPEPTPNDPGDGPGAEAPVAPGNLALSEVVANFDAGTSAAVLTWEDVEGETGFELERQDLLLGGPFARIARLQPNATSYPDAKIVLGRPYRYRIRAVNAEGASPYSEATQVTPLPAGATVLFDGTDLSAWEPEEDGGALWPVENGAMTVLPGENVGDNDLRTAEDYRDFRVHVEFNVPESPEGASEQERGNSGVYLQGRYEIQVLDSYERTLSGEDDVGAVYGVSDASENVSLPPGEWQRYDILFTAPRFENGAKVEDARVSVRLNGTLIQDDVQIPGPTRLGNAETSEVGPVVLQAHRYPVRYRNVWVVALE